MVPEDPLLCSQESHGLRVFQNRVLNRVFGSKTGEVIGRWRNSPKELHNFCAKYN
jgi:hypothetical protein